MDSPLLPIDALQVGDLLGKGMFGAVYKGTFQGQTVAIKKIRTEEAAREDYDVNLYFSREVDILNRARHPNVLKFLGISREKNDLYIITEFVEGGNLRGLLRKGFVEYGLRVKIALQIASSLNYLHRNKIIHRDVKTENVLLAGSGNDICVKLCDFGFSRSNDDNNKKMTFCGSEWFEPPEIMFCMDYDERVDIFSYGVVMCELLSRQEPSMAVFKRVVPGFGLDKEEIRKRAEENCPEELITTAIQCSEADPEDRPTLDAVSETLKPLYQRLVGQEFQENDQEVEDIEVRSPPEPDAVSPPTRPMSQIVLSDDHSPASAAAYGSYASVPASPTSPRPISIQSKYLERLYDADLEEDMTSSSSSQPAFIDVRPTYSSSTLVAMARLQLAAVENPNSKSLIPQKDHLAWREFLMEFRSKIKVRDMQKASGTITLRRMRIYQNCFNAYEAIDWLVREKNLRRVEGLEIIKTLGKMDVIREAAGTSSNDTKVGTMNSIKDSRDALLRFSDDGIFFRREKAPSYLQKPQRKGTSGNLQPNDRRKNS